MKPSKEEMIGGSHRFGKKKQRPDLKCNSCGKPRSPSELRTAKNELGYRVYKCVKCLEQEEGEEQ